jgi:hypothetical protein
LAPVPDRILKHVRNLAAFFAGVLITMQSAIAIQMTTADLMFMCSASDRYSCQLYILGVAEGAALGARMQGERTQLCIPKEATATKLTEIVEAVVTEDLQKTPADRDAPAVSMIVAILLHQFPCAKSVEPGG